MQSSPPPYMESTPETPSPLWYVTNADNMSTSEGAGSTHGGSNEGSQVPDAADVRKDSKGLAIIAPDDEIVVVAEKENVVPTTEANPEDLIPVRPSKRPKGKTRTMKSKRPSSGPSILPTSRKRTIKWTSKAVKFDAGRDEVRLIDPNSTVSYPLPQVAASNDETSDELSEIAEPTYSLYGDEHLPKRSNKLRELVKLQAELESLRQRTIGKPSPSKTRSPSIIFRDEHTKMEFVMLRRELPAYILEVIEKHEEDSIAAGQPDFNPSIEFEATPMAVWLYVCFLRYGQVRKSPFYGWQELVKTYPPLAEASYLSGLLAALALAKSYEDLAFEACVVEAIAEQARQSLSQEGD